MYTACIHYYFQGLKEFLHYNFLRDDFKLLVKSAPRVKDLQNTFPRTRNPVANIPGDTDEGAYPFNLDIGELVTNPRHPQIDRQIDRLIHGQTDRLADWSTDSPLHRLIDRLSDRCTD